MSGCVAQEESLPLSCLCPKKDNSAHLKEDWPVKRLRLIEGADIYQIAKNCRTSVEMIEKYYAAHIKTSLDAAAINVMRPKENKSVKAIQSTQALQQPADDDGVDV